MTDRKSRFQVIRKVHSRSQEEIIRQLNTIETHVRKDFFQRIFLSTTVDNGCEFLNPEALESSRYKGKSKRMNIFYAHPYCSFEWGTNENHNSIIRRFLPKGTKMENVTEKKAVEIQNWMNNLPRKILGGKTPKEVLLESLTIED